MCMHVASGKNNSRSISKIAREVGDSPAMYRQSDWPIQTVMVQVWSSATCGAIVAV